MFNKKLKRTIAELRYILHQQDIKIEKHEAEKEELIKVYKNAIEIDYYKSDRLKERVTALLAEIDYWKGVDSDWKKIYDFLHNEFEDLSKKYQKLNEIKERIIGKPSRVEVDIVPKTKAAVKKVVKKKR